MRLGYMLSPSHNHGQLLISETRKYTLFNHVLELTPLCYVGSSVVVLCDGFGQLRAPTLCAGKETVRRRAWVAYEKCSGRLCARSRPGEFKVVMPLNCSTAARTEARAHRKGPAATKLEHLPLWNATRQWCFGQALFWFDGKDRQKLQ